MVLNWDYFSDGNKIIVCKNQEEANVCIKMAESHGFAPWDYEAFRYFSEEYMYFGIRKDRKMWFFVDYISNDHTKIFFDEIVFSCDIDKSELSKILDLC